MSSLRSLEKIEDILIDIYSRLPHVECPDLTRYVRVNYGINLIEKELKSLEIIKKYLSKCENYLYETDNDFIFLDFRISQEEYDLLKEVLL